MSRYLALLLWLAVLPTPRLLALQATPQGAAVPAQSAPSNSVSPAPTPPAVPSVNPGSPTTGQAPGALPPMAPTVLKSPDIFGAVPAFPSPLPASVANRGSTQAAPGNVPSTGNAAGTSSNRRSSGPLTNFPAGLSAASGGVTISGLGSSSAPWSIVLLLTALTLIPSLLICVTPFARLLVVFHFLRQALGLQTTPSNQTLIGLTMILTFFIMQPVGEQIYHRSFEPLQRGQITAFEAISRGQEPLRNFMVHYVREKDAALFLEIAKEPRPHDVHDLSMRVLLPAYIVSELKAGFQIGAVLFLPFLVVDMVVASITTSVGMMQLPPVVISTPLKLLLFLMVDGWHLLIGALMRSFM